MTREIAHQIATLLNTQNRLTVEYNADMVLEHAGKYIYRLGEDSRLLGTVEVKKVQWYQWEIDHLSVDPSAKNRGIGSARVTEAEAKARNSGARIVQCTIRVGNEASANLFKKQGFVPTVTFRNEQNGNQVTVFQKALVI